MGVERVVSVASFSFPRLIAALQARGVSAELAMLDGRLVLPETAIPAGWRELRVRTAAGMVTLAQRPGAVAVVVFGNADAALQRAQGEIAAALEESAP